MLSGSLVPSGTLQVLVPDTLVVPVIVLIRLVSLTVVIQPSTGSSSTVYVQAVDPSSLYAGRFVNSQLQSSAAVTFFLATGSSLRFRITVMLSGSSVPSGALQILVPDTLVVPVIVLIRLVPLTVVMQPSTGSSSTVYVYAVDPSSLYAGSSVNSQLQSSAAVTFFESTGLPLRFRITVMLSGSSLPSGALQVLVPDTLVTLYVFVTTKALTSLSTSGISVITML